MLCLGFLIFSGWEMVITDRCRGEEMVDRIVAVVNEEIITLSDLNAVYRPVLTAARARGYSLKKQRKILFKARADILEDLIDNMLVDQEVKRLNLSVREAEIAAAIRKEKDARVLTDREFREYLKQQGLTVDKYRKRIRLQMLREKMIDSEIISKVVVTPQEIATYYEQHRGKYAGKREYHLLGIIKKVPPGIVLEEKKRLDQEMEMIVKNLQSGIPFLTVAKTYSKPPFAA
ncbi:MAG: SurA N-terminal domain-containing protein, partial [Deltaproteobacteria bacterium]|nr:SurA N-terminal domain-containing protein [Deltaproteobacteria bacterium]